LGSMGMGGQDLEELMVMEAMRLSLVEHEEQQRREAANRDQNSSSNPEAASTSSDTTVPTPLPLPPSVEQSIAASEPGSGPRTPTPSAAVSPTPAVQSSLQPSTTMAQGLPSSTLSVEGTSRNNRSLAPAVGPRTRTPSPTNPHPSDSLQPPSESSNLWHRRSPSPRPFSTIAAAMSATSTATAILEGEDASIRGPNAAGTSGSSSTPATTNRSQTPTISSGALHTEGISSPSSRDSVNVAANPTRPPVSIQTESYASSMFSTESTGRTTGSTYDVLESSPDSEFSREPLLGSSSFDTPMMPESGLPEVPSRVGEGAVG
jgi:hypothetical protein